MKTEKLKPTDEARGGSNKAHEEECTCRLRKIATWQGVCDNQEGRMKEDSDAYASDKRVNFLLDDSGALIESDHETCGEVGEGVSRYCGYYYAVSILRVACG
jgi:hypothetical protein